mmetsp:Transcript_21747/g.30670  ORF Transcript_21747/g.30670 Transcript_21747/m.30670 type:complete len:109 (+) Transcript_21747:364-690(+)
MMQIAAQTTARWRMHCAALYLENLVILPPQMNAALGLVSLTNVALEIMISLITKPIAAPKTFARITLVASQKIIIAVPSQAPAATNASMTHAIKLLLRFHSTGTFCTL